MKTRALVLAAGVALGGCASVPEYDAAGRQALLDAHGNVTGYKQFLRSERTGEVAAQVRMFKPIHNDAGELVGYEEQTPDGAIIRDLDGRHVGARFNDLRSGSHKTRSKSFGVIIGSFYDRPTVAMASVAAPAAPAAAQLVASFSDRDLRSIR